jgi:hypothetical protein
MENKVDPIKLKITPQQIQNSPTLKCSCGGIVFVEGIVFKKISAILSPSGKEELAPINIIMCKNCGKVPDILDYQNILPKEIIDIKLIVK